ncbi:MAG: adenine-specific methyltransferase EcoRI family protein [Prevotella sp.]|nr:adenine-specific methyltransferase EcoRI family protein [Prevotella sp.]
MAGNKNLRAAMTAKKDEFYTQYADIQTEINAYLEYNPDTFRDKVVLCNCDDPYESNFFKFFALNFNLLGLKRLICTCWNGSPITGKELNLFDETPSADGRSRVAYKAELTKVDDQTGDGLTNLPDIRLLLEKNKPVRLSQNGDFRSDECVALLREADIVVTNPPFSLFREYVAQLVEYDKKFLIIGNLNAVTYKEVFPLIKANKLWLGPSITSGDRKFNVPEEYALNAAGCGVDENGRKFIRVKGVRWFTNIDHGKRHEPLSLMTMEQNIRYSKHKDVREFGYRKYDNYDAIDVPYTDAIPADYDGIMGVPITFLDKYCPEQFEIIGMAKRGAGDPALKSKVYTKEQYSNYSDLNAGPTLFDDNGNLYNTYPRILIRKLK